MKILIIFILAGFFAMPSLAVKDGLPDQFSFKTSYSGTSATGEYFRDNFTVTALGQIFWENSSNTFATCPHLAGQLKGQLKQKELSTFALLAKEALQELEVANKSYKAETNERTSHEWNLTYGDKVYSQPMTGGKVKVQQLQALMDGLKNGLDASSVVSMSAKATKDGRYDIMFHFKGKSPLALVFTDKFSDAFNGQFQGWKYYQMPPHKIVLSEQNPNFQLTVIPPKNEQTRPEHFIYSNIPLADHYESKELGDQAGYRPIKVCAPL